VSNGSSPVSGQPSPVSSGSSSNLDPRSSDLAVTRSPVTAVTMQSLSAGTDGTAVVVTWKTGTEVNTLGFHVYREEDGRLVRVTKEAHRRLCIEDRCVSLSAGHRYSVVDAGSRVQGPGSRYYLEDIDLNGTKTMHGPVVPTLSDTPVPPGEARRLSDLRGEKKETPTRTRVVKGTRGSARQENPALPLRAYLSGRDPVGPGRNCCSEAVRGTHGLVSGHAR